MTKQLISIAALALALTGSAFAADLPSYKAPPPPPPPPPPLWTGFYVGLNAGGAWADNKSVNLSSFGAILNPVLVGDPGADAVLLSSALGSVLYRAAQTAASAEAARSVTIGSSREVSSSP